MTVGRQSPSRVLHGKKYAAVVVAVAAAAIVKCGSPAETGTSSRRDRRNDRTGRGRHRGHLPSVSRVSNRPERKFNTAANIPYSNIFFVFHLKIVSRYRL